MPGPFYFAWVDASATTFGPEHLVEDELVHAYKIEHLEGQIPTLAIDVRNPGIGLLAPGRKQWAWLAWAGVSPITPIFFGRLVGVPTDLTREVVQLSFIARPLDYIQRKQTLAETLKVRPWYDPIFIDAAKRDDPDTILEGYSALWHVDRVDHTLSISDLIVGEDGEEVFTEDDAFYESVKVTLNQPPLTSIQVKASVHWTQRTPITPISFGQNSVLSYAGASLVSDWPKPGSDLGGGWTVGAAVAVDAWQVSRAVMYQNSVSWSNKEQEHENGDTISNSSSVSYPMGAGPMRSYLTDEVEQIGLVDAFADPPINRPAKIDLKFMFAPLWLVATNLVINYQANRQRTEQLTFTLTGDFQPILTDPDQPSITDAELITKQGADVGLPVLNVLSWFSVAGRFVSIGEIILVPVSGVPLVLEPSYQIVVVEGVAGSVEPSWNLVQGGSTVSGGATFVNLGATLATSAPDWTLNTEFALGTIILPLERKYLRWGDLVPPDAPFTGTGGNVALGQIISTGAGFQEATQGGMTDIAPPGFSSSPGGTVADGGVIWTCIGASIPDGRNYQLVTQPGKSGGYVPSFTNPAGTTTIDGGVIWTALGAAEGSIAMPIGDASRRSYFPTDRGLWSLEYLIAVARAHLLHRARAVQIQFDCRMERALTLSCRKSATLHDHRLPGGVASGKIISYVIHADGDKGELGATITIACTVGKGNAISAVAGTPCYGDDYDDGSYQYYSGGTIVLPSFDIGYSAPADATNDDGLVFPLTRRTATMIERWHGNLGDQAAALDIAGAAEASAVQAEKRLQGLEPGEFLAASRAISLLKAIYSVPRLLAHRAIWYELQLNPVAGQRFDDEYVITTSMLTAAKQIDLEAPSSP